MIRDLAVAIQSDFQNLKLPANIITESLLSRGEGQYSKYLNLMTIQMMAGIYQIFKDLLKSAEKQTGLTCKRLKKLKVPRIGLAAQNTV
jgi:hypothetical protein